MFKIYPEELRLFVWVAGLMFVMTASFMLLNNYAETVFLKRYGVKKLPNIYLINSVITFFLMNYIMLVLQRISTIRLLRWLFIICPATVLSLRLFLSFPGIVYPLYYILKTQYETLLLLMFWNLGNELFNTRQSKRIFPIIMAGGVLGRICGSASTGLIASWIRVDNIVFVYGALQFTCFFLSVYLERGFAVIGGEKLVRGRKKKSSFIDEMKSILPLAREHKLFKILIITTLMANLMIPLFNYQFNYVLDRHFVSEGGLIDFFGWFRSAFNCISFVLLMLTGRFFAFFGLTTAFLFHPFNYILVFLATLFHFKLGSVMYGRISTAVIRSTLNAPSLAAIMGLFPKDVGSKARPLLRGTIVRIGTFGGSLVLLAVADVVKPNLLSILGVSFGLIWFFAMYYLRKHYVEVVVSLLLQKRVDFEQIEKTNIKALFKDPRAASNLVEGFKSERGESSIWFLDLLKVAEVPRLVEIVLESLPDKEERIQRRLIAQIRSRLTAEHFPEMEKIWDKIPPAAQFLFLEAMAGIPYEGKSGFFKKVEDTAESKSLQYAALLGLCRSGQAEERAFAEKKLTDLIPAVTGKDVPVLMRVIGETQDEKFAQPLLDRFHSDEDGLVKAYILRALRKLNKRDLNDLVFPIISSPAVVTPLLRKTAIEALDVHDKQSLKEALTFLNSRHRKVRRLMMQKIAGSDIATSADLLPYMLIPKRDVREGVLEFLRQKGVTELELQDFINSMLADAYRNIFTLVRIENLKPDQVLHVISKKLEEDTLEIVSSILYALELQYESDDLKRIRRLILSGEGRTRANAVEALEGLISANLATRLVPLVDEMPYDAKGKRGKKFFPISPKPEKGIEEMVQYITSWGDPVLNGCVINYAVRAYPEIDWKPLLISFETSPYAPLRESATLLLEQLTEGRGEDKVEKGDSAMFSIMDKILHLKTVQIFADLKINELAAIATIAKEVKHGEKEVVIEEGDLGDSLFLIIDGEVAVIKNYKKEDEVLLATLGPGEYFGEMALFEAKPRSATIKTLEPSHFLFLDKEEFADLVEEYPKIALNMGRVLSNRLREIHGKIISKDEVAA